VRDWKIELLEDIAIGKSEAAEQEVEFLFLFRYKYCPYRRLALSYRRRKEILKALKRL